MDGGVMGKFFINHTQKVVMDWREVFKGFYVVGGKWERDGLVPSKGARLLNFFVSVYPLTYIYRFGFI